MLRILTITVCLLAPWCAESHAVAKPSSTASSERIGKERACHSVAVWAVDVFNTLKQNPQVGLAGMDPEDENAFAFIRQWIADGKARDELYAYTLSRCLGTEV